MAYWTKYAETHYRRSLKDEPMPGIRPKYTARTEIAMAIFQALEKKGKEVPAGLFAGDARVDIQGVDCYAIAERLLRDEVAQRIDSEGSQRHRPRAGKQREVSGR
jgi:hypothetical protein